MSLTKKGAEVKHFLSYDNARAARQHVLKLLRTEGYNTEYLNVEIIGAKKGFFIEATSETDPQMVTRFRHLLREYVRTMRKYVTVQEIE